MDVKHWAGQADRVRKGDGYTYESLARDLVDGLGWTAAVDLAAALRGHVYGWPGDHPHHQDIKPLYDRLGWEQAALLACWFRNARNRPGIRPQKRPSGRRPGGWPAAAPAAPSTTSTCEENQWESGTT